MLDREQVEPTPVTGDFTRFSAAHGGSLKQYRAIAGERQSTEAKNLGNGPKENLQTRQIP